MTLAAQRLRQPGPVERGHHGPLPGKQLAGGALGDDATAADHDDLVGRLLHLVQQVGGQQHRASLVGEPAQQAAHPVDALRVETVGGLVEDQDLRVAQQSAGDAEALAHPERVVAQPAARLVRRQADEREHLVDAGARSADGDRSEREGLATRAARVLGGCVEQGADLKGGVGQVAVARPQDPGLSRGGRGQAAHDAHGGGLAGAVGPEEAGHDARSGREGHVVDGGERAVPLGQVVDLDHGHQSGARTLRDASGLPPYRDRPSARVDAT